MGLYEVNSSQFLALCAFWGRIREVHVIKIKGYISSSTIIYR